MERYQACKSSAWWDGKIVESWANRDDLGALRQRGVISFSGASELEILYQFRQFDS